MKIHELHYLPLLHALSAIQKKHFLSVINRPDEDPAVVELIIFSLIRMIKQPVLLGLATPVDDGMRIPFDEVRNAYALVQTKSSSSSSPCC